MVIESGFFVNDQPTDIISDNQFSEIQELAQGSYCQLLRAKRQGQWWVLKCLKSEYAQQNFYAHLLQKEYNILTRLQHPSVIRAVGVEAVSDLGQCIVMEHVSGATLDVILKDKNVSRSERKRLFLQLLDAVEYVHSQQIVHRDLKPQNILVSDNGRYLKLIDFGLADADNFAILKQPAGTLRYVSPEQQEGAIADVRNDVYSLGVILDELQLGVQYGGVVRRCLCPAPKRYATVATLRSAFLRAERFPKWMLSTASLLCVCLLLILYIHSREEHAVEVSAAVSTPVVQESIIVQHDTVVVSTPATALSQQEDAFEEAYAAATKKVDQYMKEKGLPALESKMLHGPLYKRTRPEVRSDKADEFYIRHSEIVVGTWELIMGLKDEYGSKLTVEKRTVLYQALVTYAQNTYTNKLLDIWKDYDRREQEYNQALLADGAGGGS